MDELCMIVNEQGLQELKEIAEEKKEVLESEPVKALTQGYGFKTVMGMPFFVEEEQEPKFKIMRLRNYELWRHLKRIGIDPDKILPPDKGRFSVVLDSFGPSLDEFIEQIEKAMGQYQKEGY